MSEMAFNSLKSVQDMLNEEKWTRSTLRDYSTNQFKDLDVILREAQDENALTDLKNLCDEHLIHTKNSIIALYLSGMISLSRQLIDDAALTLLVTLFVDQHKWDIVRYLCDRILDYGESKFALRKLAECYKNEDDNEKVYDVWERLVKVDFDEADIVKQLAERAEDKSDIDTAIDYYKKALHRYLNKGMFSPAREIWDKLLVLCPEDIEFFLHVSKKTEKSISSDKAVILLQNVCDLCRKRGDLDTAINILKLILSSDERDNQARKDIIDCYRKKYEKHSQLDEYIRISNLNQNYRNIHVAIMEFEKHIAFDKGNFVYHRTWGVGRIALIKGDEIIIDFAKKREHSMSLKMAVNALQTLSKNHIWVLKATWSKEKLREKVKSDIDWTLKTVIRSFDNACSMKKVKEELSAILTTGEWTSWSVKAKQILNSDPAFGVSPDDADIYTVREHPMTLEEKLYLKFKAEKSFFDRAKTLSEFVSRQDFETDSDYFVEMFAYFMSYLKTYTQVNEQIVASYLIVKDLSGKFPQMGVKLDINFVDLLDDIVQDKKVGEVFFNLKDSVLRESFLKHVKLFSSDWTDIYLKLFPFTLLPSMLDALEKEGLDEKLSALAVSCFENYREYREAVVWLFKNAAEKSWFQKADISYERQLITLIRILDVTYREIENHRNATENRKTNKQVYTILFKEGALAEFVDGADSEVAARIYAFINDVKDLDPADKAAMKARIVVKHPDFKFTREIKVKETEIPRDFIVTQAKYTEKQKQHEHIQNVEIPANSKELEFALSLGDLRENSEFKYAKERQAELNTILTRLQSDLERAKIFDPKTVDVTRASFGTKVTLKNSGSGDVETFTLLGQWESAPENGIISYLSPFGGAMWGKAVGDTFEFTAGGGRVSYTVECIEEASL